MINKRILCLLACLSVLGLLSTHAEADLSKNYTVAVSDSATPLERRAGVLLAESGIGKQEGRRTIHVGVSLASMTLGRSIPGGVDWAALGEDGIAIFKADNGDIVIAGGRASGGRGTVHAAVRFLEDQVGCRWWPDGTHVYPGNTSHGAIPAAPGSALQAMTGLGGEGEETYQLIGGPAFKGASMWPAAWALKDPSFGREQTLGGALYVANAVKALENPATHKDGSLCLSDEHVRKAVIAKVRHDLEAVYPRVKRVELGVGSFDPGARLWPAGQRRLLQSSASSVGGLIAE